MTPEQAFSHPFISKAVNELKCLKDQPSNNQTSSQSTQHPNDQNLKSQSKFNKGQSKSNSKLPTIGKN